MSMYLPGVLVSSKIYQDKKGQLGLTYLVGQNTRTGGVERLLVYGRPGEPEVEKRIAFLNSKKGQSLNVEVWIEWWSVLVDGRYQVRKKIHELDEPYFSQEENLKKISQALELGENNC